MYKSHFSAAVAGLYGIKQNANAVAASMVRTTRPLLVEIIVYSPLLSNFYFAEISLIIAHAARDEWNIMITYVITASTEQKHIDPAAIGALNCAGAAVLCSQSDNGSKFRAAEG